MIDSNNNKIYILEDGNLLIIDPEIGIIEYNSGQMFSDGANSNMTYFEGVLYWTAIDKGYSWIYGFRLSDKKLVLKMRSPNAGKPPYYNDAIFDRRGISIDPETRLGYTHDGFFAQCYMIPEKYE